MRHSWPKTTTAVDRIWRSYINLNFANSNKRPTLATLFNFGQNRPICNIYGMTFQDVITVRSNGTTSWLGERKALSIYWFQLSNKKKTPQKQERTSKQKLVWRKARERRQRKKHQIKRYRWRDRPSNRRWKKRIWKSAWRRKIGETDKQERHQTPSCTISMYRARKCHIGCLKERCAA